MFCPSFEQSPARVLDLRFFIYFIAINSCFLLYPDTRAGFLDTICTLVLVLMFCSYFPRFRAFLKIKRTFMCFKSTCSIFTRRFYFCALHLTRRVLPSGPRLPNFALLNSLASVTFASNLLKYFAGFTPHSLKLLCAALQDRCFVAFSSSKLKHTAFKAEQCTRF